MRLRSRLILLDTAVTTVCWAGTLALALSGAWAREAVLFAVVAAVTMTAVAVQQLYQSRVCAVRSEELLRLFRSAASGGLVAMLGARALGVDASTALIWTGAAGWWVAAAGARGAFASWLRVNRARGRFSRAVAVVGMDAEAVEICQLLRDHAELGYEVRGFVAEPWQVGDAPAGLPWLGAYADVAAVVAATGLTGVVLVTGAVPAADRRRVLGELVRAGVRVQLSSGIGGVDHRRMRPVPLGHEPLFYLEPATRRSPAHLALKRALDVVVSAAALVLAAPALAAAAAAIRLHDGGPVLFRQERVGRDGKLFTVYKLRTMVPDASARLGELLHRNQRHGPLFKLGNDPRVTPVGRFLRATSLDELPQLVNVLNGTMSLIGPRPALPSEVEQFDTELLRRLSVPPGITGLWQVEARDNPSWSAYRRLDLFYVDNWSWSLDLYVLLATLQVVAGRSVAVLSALARSGKARSPGHPDPPGAKPAPSALATVRELRLG
jgi:exopolysaccharide biosynthesis polyprenyl glycosylphosphotransferase